jgi:Domain of unknown function (DUF1963)
VSMIDTLRKTMRTDIEAACNVQLLALTEAKKKIGDGRHPGQRQVPGPEASWRRQKAAALRKTQVPNAAEVSAFIDMLVREAKPVASMRCTPSVGPAALGASRIAGMPDMPLLLDWPEYQGNPMAFLAQFDLASLPTGHNWPVPKSGWLYLFLAEITGRVSVRNMEDMIVTARYFEGALSDLQPRAAPAHTVRPSCLTNVAPQSVVFELALCPPIVVELFTGYAWTEDFPNCGTLFGVGANREVLEIDSPGLSPHLAHHNDRLFGYRHVPDLIADVKMWAVIRGAGLQQISLHSMRMTTEEYSEFRHSDEVRAEFFKFADQRAAFEVDWTHWDQLISLGTSCGFNWGECADGLQVFVDTRESVTGDFSNLQSFNRYLRGYD